MLEASTARSIAQGGAKIKALESGYETYLQELVVCSECGAPVFLKAKNSIYRKPHWAHFPGTGLNCPFKSKPQPVRPDYMPSDVEEKWRAQSMAAFKNKILLMLAHTYKIKGTEYEKSFRNIYDIIDYARVNPFIGMAPKQQFSTVLKKIIPLSKNLTALVECAEMFWEDFLTMPMKRQMLVNFGRYAKFDANYSVNNYLRDLLNDNLKMSQVMLNRLIYLEAVKFLCQPEATRILQWWIALHWQELATRLSHLYVQEWMEELKVAPLEKYFLLMSIADMVHLPWSDMVEDARKGNIQERPIERVIYNPKNDMLKGMYEILTPINVASIKGFGK